MENKNQILELVSKYQSLVHTQSKEMFDEVFAQNEHCNLVAITAHFTDRESIYNDFLLGRIGKNYSRIDLIADEITVNEISDELAIVIFKYHTDCDLRETGEPFGFAGIESQIMVKEDGQWRILHVHYSK